MTVIASDEVEAEEVDVSTTDQGEVKEAKDESKKEKKQIGPAPPPPPPAPPAPPEIKISQLAPIAVMMGLQKYNLEEMGYARHAEIAFVITQILGLLCLGYIYKKINEMPEGGEKLKIPEQKQFGQVIAPAVEQTPLEYDMGKWKEQAKQAVMGFGIMGGVYFKWGYLMPLVLQVFMNPLQLYESPLFQLHVWGADKKRPFPVPKGPLDGLSALTGQDDSAPAEEPAPVENKKDEKKKDK
jgi:hypothetical protein